jgi:predicted O-methyltransferase YrrM
MKSITDHILSKTDRLQISPEITPGDHGFSMFNDAGTEVEVSEFLYCLVRMMKPDCVLETGTHKGVSAAYMGQALEDNNRGAMHTFEIIPPHFQDSQRLLADLGIKRVNFHLLDAQQYDATGLNIDLLFLDSEPQLRFDEFLKFWPSVRDGGVIAIHDLHANLGHHGMTYHDEYDWPYGDFREKIGPFIKTHDVQVISFPTPRGITLFQKTAPDFTFTQHLRGEI